MAQAVRYIILNGQLQVLFNNLPLLNASRVSIRVANPISKQKSATTVGIAKGIPDPSGNMKLMSAADGSTLDPLDLLDPAYDNGTMVIVNGLKRYQVSGVNFTEASMDNDPGAGSLDNTVGFEGALFKRIK